VFVADFKENFIFCKYQCMHQAMIDTHTPYLYILENAGGASREA